MAVNKKITIGVLIAVVLIFCLFFVWIIFQKEKDFFVPPKEGLIEEEAIEKLLEELTPKDVRPLTEEEKQELEEALDQLTPSEPKSITEEEKKEMEYLLEQMTP